MHACMLKSAIDRLFHPLTPPQRSSHSIIDRFDTLDVPVSPMLGYSNRVSTPESIHYRALRRQVSFRFFVPHCRLLLKPK